jgi:class 3 adenylate cyclase
VTTIHKQPRPRGSMYNENKTVARRRPQNWASHQRVGKFRLASACDPGPDLAGRAVGGRKLIAIVYADMVGYSRLISLDDAGTLRRQQALRHAVIDPAIREYGGKLVQTGGDSLLIAFDSIDGAVRCAVKVQQQVPIYDGDQPTGQQIRFRVGIDIGDVIVNDTGLHGDGVNVAARLEAQCPAGGICVSRAVRDHVREHLKLAFEAIGFVTLKNIARPVEAFVLQLDPASADGWTHKINPLAIGHASLASTPIADKPDRIE